MNKNCSFCKKEYLPNSNNSKYCSSSCNYKSYRTGDTYKKRNAIYTKSENFIKKRKEYDLKNKEKKKEYNLKNKELRKEYRLKNKEKIKSYKKEYSLKNKEKIKEYNKQWKLNNIEHLKEYYLKTKEHKSKYGKTYCLKNKKRIKEYNYKNKERRNKNHIIRNKIDPNYRMGKNLRSRVWSALKGINKSYPTMELIGCSVDKLWNHLESKFEPWMTKENYGLWHVDHKIACAKFDLTCPEQQRVCFHYTNLQPMEAIENMRKGAR
tara:strand:+ start:44 stop:838 length:795 start_codon:yes stop_codon:yes gene_type:complete